MIEEREVLREIVIDAIAPIIAAQTEHARRLTDVEKRVDRLVVSVHGDPDVRSGPPALFEMVNGLEKRLMTRMDESDRLIARQIQTIGGIVRKHDEFIKARMQVERAVFKWGGRLFKLAGAAGSHTLIKAVVSVIGGSAIGLIGSARTGLL